MAEKLAIKITAATQVDSVGPGSYSVKDTPNLILRVKPTGTRSWVFRYSSNGKVKEVGLGKAGKKEKGVVGLAEARELAAAMHTAIRKGADPRTTRTNKHDAAAMTFKRYAERYVEGREADHTPDEEHRAARHDRETRELADQTQADYNEKVTRAESELARAHADVEKRLTEKAGLKADPAWRNTVVGVFYDMPNDGARSSSIADLIEQGDHASLAALIEAPLVVTKLPAAVRDTIKERVFAKIDAQGVKLRDALALAQTRLSNAHLASFAIFDKLRANTHIGAAKDRAAKAAARNMAANFGRR